MIDIESLTMTELRQLAALASGLLGCGPTKAAADHPVKVGQSYLIFTVTHQWLGRVAAVADGCYVLHDASWLAYSGVRLGELLATQKFTTDSEVERMPDGLVVPFGAIIGISPWSGALPEKSL